MPTSKFDNFVEKHFDDRKLASPPKPPTPHHHHRIDPKEAEHHSHDMEKDEFGDPDYQQDIREEKRDRAQMRREQLPMSVLREFQRRKLETQKKDMEQGIKGMPELYVNYPDVQYPTGKISPRQMLERLAQPGGQRPEVPGEEGKVPDIPIDAKRAFDSGYGMRAFGPEEHRTDYPRNLTEWKLTNVQNSISKLVKLVKEGDGGAGIDGLSGVVFTSENAGVFTPTHGGHHTTAKKRESIKRKHDKKRKQLLGKQKKNGVDRLEQFVKKAAQELPLQRIKNMSGRAGTEYAPTHQSGNRMQLDYKKEGEKRTMGEDLQPNSSLSGLNSSLEQGRQATEPQSEDISVSRQDIPKRTKWDANNAAVVKYSPGSVTSLGSQPDQNPEAEPPQYIERGKSKSENKNQQQDVKMNDITNKVKKLSDEDADVEQPAGAVSMAVKEVNKQMSPWGSGGSIDRDELKRGGDLDELEDGEEEEPTESELVINAIKRLQERKQKHLDKGADDALFLAMMEDVDAV